MNQSELSKVNKLGWNDGAYKAWVKRYGLPQDYALTLKENPTHKVSDYLTYMGEVRGKKIANLLGSKGNKAVSFALLGAEVTVVDISEENRKYAVELAEGAGVKIHYIVSDLLEIPAKNVLLDFNFVVLELGVLHYFVDLVPVFEVVKQMLKPGGTFILRDYHPVLTKLLKIEDNRMVAGGNYFETDEIEVDVAFWKLLHTDSQHPSPKNMIRRWTLGDIITSLAKVKLEIVELGEESGIRWAFPPDAPEGIEDKVPGLYTIITKKG
ncbi:class I SAM-dependent methyltransferase [Rossellomorea aquimaris]|uniref:class I SAM-dependent methyltransferase n=1 Tax=Rossellomorea aquimaris TaxID=189382 RepID=UPI001CD60905|nr:class I SAM-dependent methyltransferase [Rossellomorea aquimaris]MCA1058810.1 class I SAM-dependent methyltransferase [Rossellomorea aquimaris]